MKLETPRSGIFCAEPLARQAGPQTSAGAKFRYLLKETDRDIKEKREARQKAIGVHAARDAVLCILQRCRNNEAHRFRRCCPSLLRMLSDYGQGVPARL